jgi:hypothetical protein
MQRKIMFHLSGPTCRIGAIKFIDLDVGKTRVMQKGVGLKMHRMRGINSIGWVRGGRTRRVVQQLVDNILEGAKLVHEVGFHGVKFVLDLGLELFKARIGRGNLRCHVIDGSFQVLVASGGHLERGSAGKEKWVGGTTKRTYK